MRIQGRGLKISEHELQCACVRMFHMKHKGALIWATPNGGQRHIAVAAKMRKEGVLPGVPDLFIPEARGGYHGLFVEMKSGKNKATPAQVQIMGQLHERGYKCEVVNSLEYFDAVTSAYLRGDIKKQ